MIGCTLPWAMSTAALLAGVALVLSVAVWWDAQRRIEMVMRILDDWEDAPRAARGENA